MAPSLEMRLVSMSSNWQQCEDQISCLIGENRWEQVRKPIQSVNDPVHFNGCIMLLQMMHRFPSAKSKALKSHRTSWDHCLPKGLDLFSLEEQELVLAWAHGHGLAWAHGHGVVGPIRKADWTKTLPHPLPCNILVRKRRIQLQGKFMIDDSFDYRQRCLLELTTCGARS